MSSSKIATVDDYLASLDTAKAKTAHAIIDSILAQFPETEATIAWNVPQIKRGKGYVFGLFAAKNHISLNPWSEQVLDAFKPRLEPAFAVQKTTFQVPIDWNVDRDLLRDLVSARIAELDTE